MNDFGTELKNLISITAQRNIDLSKRLNYDPSYLSKWISGKTYPSKNKIESVCESCALFFSNDLTEVNKKKILKYLNLQDCSNEVLEEKIKSYLLDAYYNVTLKENQASLLMSSSIFPDTIRYDILNLINSVYEKTDRLDIIIMTETFSLSDALPNFQILWLISKLDYTKKISAKITFSTCGLGEDFIKKTDLLIYSLFNVFDYDVEFFIIDKNIYTDVFVMHDNFAVISSFASPSKYLFNTTVTDVKEVNNIYSTYSHYIDSTASKISNKYYDSQIYFECFFDNNFQYEIDNLTELFVTDDIFYKYNKTPINVNTYHYIKSSRNFETKIILCKKAIFDFLIKREILLFDEVVTLNENESIEYLINLINILENNDKVDIKIDNMKYFRIDENDYSKFSNVCYYNFENQIVLKSVWENKVKILNITDCNVVEVIHNRFNSRWVNIKTGKEEAINFLKSCVPITE